MKETRSLPAELFAGRTLIFQLAKNDFKKKYAGSYLGIVWAFVQPVVTVMVYWFVFGMIRSSSPRPVPFVLWLIAGLIPWFFFQDGLINGTNALLQYNYLVKKVVFRIDILPMVKVVSAVSVHGDGMLSDCLYDPGDLLYVLYLCARARDHLYDQFGRRLFS